MEYFLNIQELICLYKYAYTDTHSYTHIIFKILSMENFIIFFTTIYQTQYLSS